VVKKPPKTAEPPPGSQVMTIEQALQTAYAHWNAGQQQQAEHLCQQVLAVWPENPFALHLLGLLAHSFGNLPLAVDFLRRACLSPSSPDDFHSNCAEIMRQTGLHQEAEAAARRALAINGGNVGAWTNLGIILQEAGKLEESLQALIRVCQLAPDNAEAHNNLGNTYNRLKRLNEAKSEYEAAIRLNPSYAHAYSNLGNLLKELGQLEAALTQVRQAIELDPHYADAYINASAITRALHRPAESLRWLENVLSFAPDHPGALMALAITHREDENFPAAEQAARRAVALLPQSGDAHEILGQVLHGMNRTDEALAAYAQAQTLPMPNPAGPLEKRAVLLHELGRKAEALEAYQSALEINPRSASLWFNRSDAKSFSANDPDIQTMESLLQDGEQQGLGLDDRTMLSFALGKAHLDAGQDDRAFAYLAEGNRLKRQSFDYDPPAVERWLQEIAETLSPAQIERLKGHGDPSALPIFIIGMPRSGTTLAEQILASHPQIHGAGELRLMQSMIDQITDLNGRLLGYPGLITGTAPEDLQRLAQHYLARVSAMAPGKARVVDKMPANFLFAGLIHLLFPNARIIHCRRDGVDTCLSCYTRLFSGEQKFAYDLAELGRFYKDYERLTAYWKSVLPADRFTELVYEDVVADQEAETRRLLDFCGLDWDEACLSFYELKRPVRTASVGQVRKPIYKTSVGRWRKHAQYLGPLLRELGGAETP